MAPKSVDEGSMETIRRREATADTIEEAPHPWLDVPEMRSQFGALLHPNKKPWALEIVTTRQGSSTRQRVHFSARRVTDTVGRHFHFDRSKQASEKIPSSARIDAVSDKPCPPFPSTWMVCRIESINTTHPSKRPRARENNLFDKLEHQKAASIQPKGSWKDRNYMRRAWKGYLHPGRWVKAGRKDGGVNCRKLMKEPQERYLKNHRRCFPEGIPSGVDWVAKSLLEA